MKIIIQLALLTAILITSVATAKENSNLEKFSVQGSFGHYGHAISTTRIDRIRVDTGYGLRASYRITPSIAIDAGYFDFGAYADDFENPIYRRATEEIATTAYKVGITGYYPYPSINSMELFARIGIAFWDAKYDHILIDPSIFISPYYDPAYNDSGQNLYFGIGAEYKLNQAFAFALEFSYLDFDMKVRRTDVNNTISGVVASIKYSF